MELKTLFNAGETFDKVASQPLSSTKLSFFIAKFMMETEGNRQFFKKRFVELLKKYDCTVKEDGTIVVSADKKDPWTKEVEELAGIEVEAPKTKIPLSLLVDTLSLSPQDMIYLLPFVDEEK